MKFIVIILIAFYGSQLIGQTSKKDTITLDEIVISSIDKSKFIQPKKYKSKSAFTLKGKSPIFYSKLIALKSDIFISGIGLKFTNIDAVCEDGYFIKLAIAEREKNLDFKDITKERVFYVPSKREYLTFPMSINIKKGANYFLKLSFESTEACSNEFYRIGLLNLKKKHGFTLIKHANSNITEDPAENFNSNISFIFDYKIYFK